MPPSFTFAFPGLFSQARRAANRNGLYGGHYSTRIHPLRVHTMTLTLFLTMLLIFSILKPAIACGFLGAMCLHAGLQLRRARRLSSA
jgi:hypothetical protein